MSTVVVVVLVALVLGVIGLDRREIEKLKFRVWYLEHPDVSANGEHSPDGSKW